MSPGGRQSLRLRKNNMPSETEQQSDKDKNNRNAHKDKTNCARDKAADTNVQSLRGKVVEYVHPDTNRQAYGLVGRYYKAEKW